jgi:predicted nuclease of restriction endonuclease-like (RecB) superfamily
MASSKTITRSVYGAFMARVKERVLDARISAARAINKELVLLYWDIGEAIVRKQHELGWGDAIVERIAKDLQRAFPATTGFSERNVWDMRRLYISYSGDPILRQAVAELKRPVPSRSKIAKEPIVSRLSDELVILRQAVAEIPWGHHLLLLNKLDASEERLWYLRSTAQFGWSRNVLLNQIKSKAYHRSLKVGKSHNFHQALPAHFAEQAEEALKTSYDFGFLGIDGAVKERVMELALIDHIQRFIQELGRGFCFVGRQHRLTLGDKEYFVDLLFYHRFLKVLVAIDLKTGEFKPDHSGQMDFYLNLLNDTERAKDDRPSIGIILCADQNNLEVEYALRSKSNPIGVAPYTLSNALPKELRGQLPSAEELRGALESAMNVHKRKRKVPPSARPSKKPIKKRRR